MGHQFHHATLVTGLACTMCRAGMGSITCMNNELLLLLPVNSIYYITITITHPVICNTLLYYYS